MSTRKLHRSDLIRSMVAEFPEMKPRLKGMHEGIHSEVGAFLEFLQEAIDRGDRDVVAKCYAFVARSLENPNRHVRNALAVSLLEDLDLRGASRRFAVNLLPGSVRAERERVLGYYQKLTGKFRWDDQDRPAGGSRKRSRGAA